MRCKADLRYQNLLRATAEEQRFSDRKMFAYEEILAAYARVSGAVYKTPIMTSTSIDELCSKKVYFKCEHLQKTGSFKVRGALNAVCESFSNEGMQYFGVFFQSRLPTLRGLSRDLVEEIGWRDLSLLKMF